MSTETATNDESVALNNNNKTIQHQEQQKSTIPYFNNNNNNTSSHIKRYNNNYKNNDLESKMNRVYEFFNYFIKTNSSFKNFNILTISIY
jgi:hypothetical protein